MPTNPVAYPPEGLNPWDVPLKAYIDGGDSAAEAVTSVFGRTGAITAQTGDYTAAQVGAAPLWRPLTSYAAAAPAVAPDGSMISRTAPGTSRATFDPTEAALWTAVLATSGTIEQAALPGLIAYAENGTSQGTTATSVGVAILGLSLIVPPTTTDVWLEWAATLGCNTAGQGSIILTAWEDNVGSVPRGYSFHHLTSATPASVGLARSYGNCRVGPSPNLRTFYLAVAFYQEGSSLDGYTVNGAGQLKSTFMAVAR